MSELDLSKGIDLTPKPKVRGSGQIAGIARKLDEHGTFEATGVPLPNGQMAASPNRDAYLDAEELVDEITDSVRMAVRQELAAFYQRMRKLAE